MNIRDVAQRAGVSISTVSRVLNNTDYPVKPETRNRVLKAIEELKFRPNDMARGLLLKKSRIIGLVIPDISNPYYPELSLGIEATASEHGYSIIFCNTSRNLEKLGQYVDVLLQKRADGIILAGGGAESVQISQVLSDFDVCVAVVGRHNLPFPSVQVNNFEEARGATAHLVELGHRRISFLSGLPSLTSVQDRLAGYRTALKEHGIEPDYTLYHEGDFEAESGYEGAKALLQGEARPTAIFAANDRMAVGALAAAADLGLDVPKDVSVIGFDDTVLASQIRPALTTVAVPAYAMGTAVMQLLLKLLAGEECPQTAWQPTRLVIRQSSGPPPGVESTVEDLVEGGWSTEEA